MRAFLLGLLFVATTAVANVNPVKVVSAATLPIEANGTDLRYCSAVVIAPERILTAAHCVTNDIAFPAVRVEDKQLRITGWIVEQSARDIAIGIVPGLNVAPVEIGDARDVFVGQNILILGYPGGGPLKITEGQIRQLSRTVCYAYHDCRAQTTTSGITAGGNSGWPVVVIRDGKAVLIGILVGGIAEPGKEQLSTIELLIGHLARR